MAYGSLEWETIARVSLWGKALWGTILHPLITRVLIVWQIVLWEEGRFTDAPDEREREREREREINGLLSALKMR